jgi:hypothetical protein
MREPLSDDDILGHGGSPVQARANANARTRSKLLLALHARYHEQRAAGLTGAQLAVGMGRINEADATIVKAYLAEHPADDARHELPYRIRRKIEANERQVHAYLRGGADPYMTFEQALASGLGMELTWNLVELSDQEALSR